MTIAIMTPPSPLDHGRFGFHKTSSSQDPVFPPSNQSHVTQLPLRTLVDPREKYPPLPRVLLRVELLLVPSILLSAPALHKVDGDEVVDDG